MVWDYVEVNPFTDVGWPNMQEWVERIIDHCSLNSTIPSTVTHPSSTSSGEDKNGGDGNE